MRLTAIIFVFLLGPYYLSSQPSEDCSTWDLQTGTDILIRENDSLTGSASVWVGGLSADASIVRCPAGIERASENDVKKRYPFRWKVKYNNTYITSFNGLSVEGMNEHGFSASLMFLQNGRLSDKDKEHIPIGTSWLVNFFIDHFKSVDTALLAVWDIRIFDDMNLGCDWPFRLVLHDSTGASAYIEYINGERRVYTPEAPACLVGGPDYAQLITVKYVDGAEASSSAEKRFLSVSDSLSTLSPSYLFPNIFSFFNSMERISDKGIIVYRDHHSMVLQIIFNKMNVRDLIYFVDTQNYDKEETITKLY